MKNPPYLHPQTGKPITATEYIIYLQAEISKHEEKQQAIKAAVLKMAETLGFKAIQKL